MILQNDKDSMNYPNNPHDKFFKTNMSDIEIAADFIRNYFPAKLTEQMDFSTLDIQKDSLRKIC